MPTYTVFNSLVLQVALLSPTYSIYRRWIDGWINFGETEQVYKPEIKSLVARKVSDGGGLWFHWRKDGGGQWFQRFTPHGSRHEMGLGSIEMVSLKEARRLAELNRALVREGINPKKERTRLKHEATRNIHMLWDIAHDAFETRKAELRNDGKSGQWFSPLENHVLPRLVQTPGSEIDQKDIRDTSDSIWHVKADTAKKAINRLVTFMRHAAALGLEVTYKLLKNLRIQTRLQSPA